MRNIADADDDTQVSLVKPDGMITVIHSTTSFFGLAGTSVVGPSRMMSGLMAHPSGHSTAAGASLRSPSGAPASAHFAMVSISFCLSERSFR